MFGAVVSLSLDVGYSHRSVVADECTNSLAVACSCIIVALHTIAVETALGHFVHQTQMFTRSHSGEVLDGFSIAIDNHRVDADERTATSKGSRWVVPFNSGLQGTILTRSNGKFGNLVGSRSLGDLERNIQALELSSKLVLSYHLGDTRGDIDCEQHRIAGSGIWIGVHVEVPLATILVEEEVVMTVLESGTGIACDFANVAQFGHKVTNTCLRIDLVDLAPIADAIEIAIVGDADGLDVGSVGRG